MNSVTVSVSNRKRMAVARLHWLQGGVIGLLFSLFYGPSVFGLVKDWQENTTFSYGLLIPFIAVYLVWERGPRIRSLSMRPNAGGAIPLSLAVALGLFGMAIGDSFTIRVSMILALACSVYLFLGRDFLKALVFPIFYLSLMIPVPYIFFKELAYHLRFFDAALAASTLQLLNIPVYREAYFLHLPNITLTVADVCAGLGSIFALFALGNFYVYFIPVPARIKLALVLSTFPIAIFANFVRITVVAVMAYYIGPVTLDMLFHRFSGTTTFLLALMLLILLGEFLRKEWSQHSTESTISKAFPVPDQAGTSVYNWKPSAIGIGIFVSAVSFASLLNGGPSLSLTGSGLDVIPKAFGTFSEMQINWQDRYEDPKADITTSRIYGATDRTPIELFIGYKGRQNGTDRLISPKLILPKNWNFAWINPANVSLPTAAPIKGNWMLTSNGNTSRLVLYWYQFGGNTLAGEFEYRIELVKRLILDRRSDGAIVRLATAVRNDEPIEPAQERLRALAVALYPRLVEILPQ